MRPSVQSAATSNRCPIGGVRRPIGGVPISMMLRGCTKFPAVETTHIHDILRVRGIKHYFNEFLFNCLAFSRSKFVHLPHCRQHCHINRFAASGIQASESKAIPSFEFWSHQTAASSHPPPRNSSLGIQDSESKLQDSESKLAPASSTLRRIHLHGIHASIFGHIDPPRQLRHIHLYGIQASNFQEIQASHFGHFNPPSTSNRRCSPSHHLRVIHTCCKRWSRMRALARID